MDRRERGREIVKWLIYHHFVNSQGELAQALGYNATVFSAVMSGRKPFSDKLSRNLCMAHGRLNVDWLLTGEGQMLLPETRGAAPVALKANARKKTIPFFRELAVSAGQTEQPDYDDTRDEVVLAGVRAEALFPVVGHSMEPYIYEGDIVGVVTVDSLESINPDRVYMVITRDNERMIKHIAPTTPADDYITLISDNPKYAPFTVQKDAILKVMKVVFSGRTYQ